MKRESRAAIVALDDLATIMRTRIAAFRDLGYGCTIAPHMRINEDEYSAVNHSYYDSIHSSQSVYAKMNEIAKLMDELNNTSYDVMQMMRRKVE